MMSRAKTLRRVLQYIVVTLLALAVVGLFKLLLHVNPTTVALTFLVLILVVASRWRLALSVYLSLLFTLLYNYFFLPPLGTLSVADPENWVALAAFLAAGVLVSHLAESEHRQSAISERRRAEVERLYEFSQQMLLQDERANPGSIAPRLIASVFRVPAVALYLRDSSALYLSNPSDEVVSVAELKALADSGDASGTVVPGVRVLPLMLGLRSTGAIAIREGDYSEEVYGAIAGLVAVTMERAAAVERFSRVEAARESERLRTALIDSVTHELRTPLTAIRVAATTLQSQPPLPEAERDEMIAVVAEESMRLDRLIGRGIEMAQLESHAVAVHPRPQRVRQVIGQALEDCQHLLRGRNVAVDVVNETPVLMDRELVRRVLQHLIENAARYSPLKSPIVISAVVEDEKLQIKVTNYGEGVDPSDQPFLFDKFYRGKLARPAAQGSAAGGTGMGLAIAKAIVTAHGGGISLTSKPGEQTTFMFWIPVPEQGA